MIYPKLVGVETTNSHVEPETVKCSKETVYMKETGVHNNPNTSRSLLHYFRSLLQTFAFHSLP